MSTPIETNTEELQEILETVYNLPNVGGGSSAPDLVIAMNATSPSTVDFPKLEWLSVESGSAADVITKVKNLEETNIVLKVDYYYNTLHYVGTAKCISTTYAYDDSLLRITFEIPYANGFGSQVFLCVEIDEAGVFARFSADLRQ